MIHIMLWIPNDFNDSLAWPNFSEKFEQLWPLGSANFMNEIRNKDVWHEINKTMKIRKTNRCLSLRLARAQWHVRAIHRRHRTIGSAQHHCPLSTTLACHYTVLYYFPKCMCVARPRAGNCARVGPRPVPPPHYFRSPLPPPGSPSVIITPYACHRSVYGAT